MDEQKKKPLRRQREDHYRHIERKIKLGLLGDKYVSLINRNSLYRIFLQLDAGEKELEEIKNDVTEIRRIG